MNRNRSDTFRNKLTLLLNKHLKYQTEILILVSIIILKQPHEYYFDC